LRLYSVPCRLNSPDHQEPGAISICSEYRSQCLLPLITLAVRISNWNEARIIDFRECVNLYGLSWSTGVLAFLRLGSPCREESERSDTSSRALLITVEVPAQSCLS
jgi:hypothetical protein